MELLPCPFCGGEALPTAHLTYNWFAPVCRRCNARGPSVKIERDSDPQEMRNLMNQADENWNRRASPASVPEGWKHSCNALCLDGVELWIPQCPHCGKPAPTPPVSEDRKDAELLDYIQNHGATIQIVPMANRTFGFEVGGLHKSRKLSVREAIDAAMQETSYEQAKLYY